MHSSFILAALFCTSAPKIQGLFRSGAVWESHNNGFFLICWDIAILFISSYHFYFFVRLKYFSILFLYFFLSSQSPCNLTVTCQLVCINFNIDLRHLKKNKQIMYSAKSLDPWILTFMIRILKFYCSFIKKNLGGYKDWYNIYICFYKHFINIIF